MLRGVKTLSMNFSQPLPGIIKEHAYDSSIIRISGTFDRMHELDEAIEWAVIRAIKKSPERFVPLHSSNAEIVGFIWKFQGISRHFPSLVVSFAWSQKDTLITLIDIKT